MLREMLRAPPVAHACASHLTRWRARRRARVGALDELEGPFWDDFREFAGEEADELGLTVTSVAFERRTLSVLAEGGVDELQQLNQRLSGFLDNAGGDTIESMPAFVLQVSPPGVSNTLSSDKDFAAFKGSDVTLTPSFTNTEFNKKLVLEARSSAATPIYHDQPVMAAPEDTSTIDFAEEPRGCRPRRSRSPSIRTLVLAARVYYQAAVTHRLACCARLTRHIVWLL